jgi:Ca-activated chloride channel family protein
MKQEVKRLRAMSGRDRVGLLAFAGRSYILTPLTVDDAALDLYLDNLDPSVVGQAGSSLARAIRQGTALLTATRGGGDKALVVMSDGEAFEPVEEVVAEARKAADAGISLVTVGFGTPQGATIPVRVGDDIQPKRDESGQVVVTRYSPDLLRAAAEAGSGTFIDAGETDKAARVRRALSTLRTEARATESGRERTPRFQLFLLPALLLLLADTLLAERRGTRRRGPAAATPAAGVAGAALLVAALGLLAPRTARADDVEDGVRAYKAGQFARAAALFRRAIEGGDRSPATLYNFGTAMLAADSLAQAGEVLERASTTREPEVRYRALFNLGLAHLRRGLAAEEAEDEQGLVALDAALAAYKKVLLMRSSDRDAKWNYELALRKKQQSSGGGGGGGSSESQDPDPTPRQQQPIERPAGGIGQQQAERLLDSAEREESDVQAKKQRQNRPEPPPGGKDW